MFIRKNISHLATRLATALLTAATPLLLASCSWVTDDYDIDEPSDPAANYINFTLTVRGGEADAATRAPQGGEYGDGREAAFERENLVTGITVILYQSATGLSDNDARVDFIKFFPVTRWRIDDQGTTTYGEDRNNPDNAHTHNDGVYAECVYTTGDQKLDQGALDLTKKYHVLIVANQNLANAFPKGTPISEVREAKYNNVYANYTPGVPTTAQNFVITTENDAVINFNAMTPTPKTIDDIQAYLYSVTQPLYIERMAARIDFHTTGGTYVELPEGAENPTVKGYQYGVSGGGKFVITDVVPFNLYNGEEYLFKRVCADWTTLTPSVSYLADETTSNYVVDPKTASKLADNTPDYYVSTLAAAADMSTSVYKQNMATAKANTAQTYKLSSSDNIIIAYPKENTLLPTSPLKKYATGLAFIGKFYAIGSTTAEDRTYYTYLRHQGEGNESYKAWQWNELGDDWTQQKYGPAPTTGSYTAGPAMNFGIVRNNIYRVSVESITDEGIKLLIKVKHWDRFEHTPIYM